MYICAGALARARKNEPCATHWAVRQKARNSPHKPPSPPRGGLATAHRASKPRTEPARSEKTASRAQANNSRVTGGKTEHKQNTPAATKMPSNIPAAPKSQYEIERDERIKRNEAFMLSIGIDPHGGGYVLSSA